MKPHSVKRTSARLRFMASSSSAATSISNPSTQKKQSTRLGHLKRKVKIEDTSNTLDKITTVDYPSSSSNIPKKVRRTSTSSSSSRSDSPTNSERPEKIVWAKIPGSPFWPGQIAIPATKAQRLARPSSYSNPESCLASHELVVFYGERREWAWVSTDPKFMKVFGYSPDTDSTLASKCRKKAFMSAVKSAKADFKNFEIIEDVMEGPPTPSTLPSPPVREPVHPPMSLEAKVPESSQISSSPHNSGGLSDYELARQRRIIENQKQLAALGLASGSPSALLGVPSDHSSGSSAPSKKRGIKSRPKKPQVAVQPRKRSARINKDVNFVHMEVVTDTSGKIGTRELGTAGGVRGASVVSKHEPQPIHEPIYDPRAPEDSLTLESTGGTEKFGSEFLSTLRTLSSNDSQNHGSASKISSSLMDYAERLSNLKMDESTVAKVTPDRIYSVDLHPSSSNLVCAAGDKAGNLGMWHVDFDSNSAAASESDGVALFHHHERTINNLMFMPRNPSKIFSQAYDGTVRSMDIEKEVSELVVAHDSWRESDRWVQAMSVGCTEGAGSGSIVYIGISDGTAAAFDIRKGYGERASPLWNMQLHEKKINTIQEHPAGDPYIATAGLGRVVKIWDLRKLKSSQKVRPVVELPDSLSINSATFSPRGSKIVTVCQNNFLRIYNEPHKRSEIIRQADVNVRHDNKTGRYLPVFRASWDPKRDDAFVIGSMMRPRQVEVYGCSSEKMCNRIMSLQSPEWLNSVQSRNTFHPTRDVICCGNASGRIHIFR